MRSLYELEIRVNDDIDDPPHIEITVEPAVHADNAYEFGDPDRATLEEAGRHHAATLGRLGLALAPWIDYQRSAHGCGSGAMQILYSGEPGWLEACCIGHSGILRPQDEDGGQPLLWFTVPAEKQQQWLDRISDALAEIAGGGA